MSDFLVDFGNTNRSGSLTGLLRRLYVRRQVDVGYCDFSWGTVAYTCGPNSRVIRSPEAEGPRGSPAGLYVSVGDIVGPDSKASAGAFIELCNSLGRDNASDGRIGSLLETLNGAFAILVATERGVAVCTDPIGSVSVYIVYGEAGKPRIIGTHSDLVARAADSDARIDPVSVCEFLSRGAPCFPNTMYHEVKQLAPGRMYYWSTVRKPQEDRGAREFVYWKPPEEVHEVDVREVAQKIAERFVTAVDSRCLGRRIGVYLSGGLDSRMVLASVPQNVQCLALTFCSNVNREVRTARRVAQEYQREWIPLCRDRDYLVRNLMPVGRLVGCECEWIHAHGAGFAGLIADLELEAVLTGLLMNNLIKGYYAADVVRIRRFGGLLPCRYKIVPYDYAGSVRAFCREVIRKDVLEASRARLEEYRTQHFGNRRQSVCEWLDSYPFSQAGDNTMWTAERRLVPMRLPILDRRLLDILFGVPIFIKLDPLFLRCIAMKVCGIGADIPNANDGVAPSSRGMLRILQRSKRKLEESLIRLGHLGRRGPVVQHSWYDYQALWRENSLLREQINHHLERLDGLQDLVFSEKISDKILNPNLNWRDGIRVLQLAMWQAIRQELRP